MSQLQEFTEWAAKLPNPMRSDLDDALKIMLLGAKGEIAFNIQFNFDGRGGFNYELPKATKGILRQLLIHS
jgi:hypothetical protein